MNQPTLYMQIDATLHGVPARIETEPTHGLDWYAWDCPDCGFGVMVLKNVVDDIFDSAEDMKCYRCQ